MSARRFKPTLSGWPAIQERRKPVLEKADHAVNRLEDNGEDATAWRTYRQALRDITDQPDPDTVVWPDPPA